MSETHQDTSPVKRRRGSKKSQKEKNTIDHVTESIFKEDYSGLDSNEPLEEEQFISEEDSSKEWALCDWIVICVAGLFCVGFLSVFYFMYSHMMSISYIASHQGPKREAKHLYLDVNLSTLYTGTTAYIPIMNQAICSKCMGSGADRAAGLDTCPHCKGTGVRTFLQQIGHFQQQIHTTCNVCHGKGRMAKKHCDVCHGHGVHQVSKVLEVNIEPGLHHGDTVVLENKGDHIPRTRPGDVVFHLRMLHPDPFFTRKGNDLENVLSISLLEALVGFKRKLIHVDGHSVVHLDRQEMVHPKTIWRIPSKGMPIKGHKGSFGDLLIHFTIEYPSELDTSQIEAIKILLPVETS